MWLIIGDATKPCRCGGAPAGLPSIFDLEAELNNARPSGISDCAKAAGKCLLTPRSVGGRERRAQLGGKASRATGLLQNVAIEDIEKRRSEIDHASLSDLGSFSYRDVLI